MCLAFNISSHSSKFAPIAVLDAMLLRSTRNESYTPSCTGSIGSPVVRSKPTTFPSANSSCNFATVRILVSSLLFSVTSIMRVDITYESLVYHVLNWQPRSLELRVMHLQTPEHPILPCPLLSC